MSSNATFMAETQVMVAEGATVTITNNKSSEADFNVYGTLNLTSGNAMKAGNGNITATGSNALVNLATNDPFGMWDDKNATNITLKDGATMTNSVKRTGATDGTSHLTMSAALTLGNGNLTSTGIGRQGGGYGNYLLNRAITVKNSAKSADAVSTVDAYMFELRNHAGNWTIQDGATLEMCSKISARINSVTFDGGGTLRPFTQTRSLQVDGDTFETRTQTMSIAPKNKGNVNENVTVAAKDITLDLRALGTILNSATGAETDAIQTAGSDWKLLTTGASNTIMNDGFLQMGGKFTTTEDTVMQIELTVKDGALYGQTVSAENFDINDSTLELFFDDTINWEENADLVYAYELFDSVFRTLNKLIVDNTLGLNFELNALGNGIMDAASGGSGVPEPATWVLLVLGAESMFIFRRRTLR
ncbi:MAG: PEP-CTERM sorting domain-containing protein [Planctomycetia bacterium]|nr:PEP-CTERM sorting domain-containing protein [Planctomycetia bacterium]